ncbi:MAG: FkbM family methyltransferase [Opitutae bacterium]|nr:FkbM family methyltransferase [Opitutae bacterium]
MNLSRLTRAEYVCRPGQLFRRAGRILRRPFHPDRLTVGLPWGLPITVDPRESIGRSIVALSALDLPVTETIWRLVDDGETCADIGANIGYMTSVMAARLPSGGTIWSFEPVPEIAATLRENLAAWTPRCRTEFRFRPEALADEDGERAIHLSAEFPENRGTASFRADRSETARTFQVQTRRLDSLCDASVRFGLIKLDVEGAEELVLRGADALLRTGRIRDIVFEEHHPWPAASMRLLLQHGYQLWRVTRGRRGPALLSPDAQPGMELDPPTYLATRDTARTQQRFAASGWQCLGG